MSMEHVITPAEVNALRRQFDEALRHILLDRTKYEATKTFLQLEIINPHQGDRSRDLAEERRTEVAGFYTDHGHVIAVPKPIFSNKEFERRRKTNQDLFFHSAEVSYESLMTSVGQAEHWTVIDEAERKKIAFEPAKQSYWFWAEVPASCSRLSMTWNDLTGSIRLLSLEEYAIVFWITKSITGLILDVPTWCWLRTRYKTSNGLGALFANGCIGQVSVYWIGLQDLSVPNGFSGGRASEARRNGKRFNERRFRYGSSPNFFRVFFRHEPSTRPISCRRSCR